jgi:uncharacterized protein (DUF58 family)
MLTSRSWWFLLAVGGMLALGVVAPFVPLALGCLTLLLWFGWEWLLFAVRVETAVRGLRVGREVSDGRGPVATLWAGQTFRVRGTLEAGGSAGLPYLAAADPVPFGVERVDGEVAAEGAVGPDAPLTWEYRIRCSAAGVIRFEGVRVRVADLQGFFYHAAFVRDVRVFRVLPVLATRKGGPPAAKRVNLLPPPGVHRLRRPGSGSELLDLRDYLPGDPPKTIAWKVSARRDRLITKEFESEVPVRCTLFVDTSNSVRVPARPAAGGAHARPLDRLVEIAAGVIQANAAVRDPTVLCLFDEGGAEVVRPDRTGPHVTQMLHRLADAAALAPAAAHVDPARLLPLAYAFARVTYPELLRPGVNGMPWWLARFGAFPARTRRRPGLTLFLHRHKAAVYLVGTFVLPLVLVVASAAVGAAVYSRHLHPDFLWGVLVAGAVSALSVAGSTLFLLSGMLLGGRHRRTAGWRKALAALLAARYGPTPGGLSAYLEDDDAFALALQRFLAEHRVPFELPLYDAAGRYQFAAPAKVAVLAAALLRAVGRGRDNELFVLLADLVELGDDLAPLLRAAGVALARHHQVLVVCPWPAGLPLPDTDGGEEEAGDAGPWWARERRRGGDDKLTGLREATVLRYHQAYRVLRRAFGRLGVPVVCAAGGAPAALILERLDRLRRVRGRR